MSDLIFNNIRKPKHTFDISVNIPDNEQEIFYFKIIDFGEFEYGNNNKEENIYYPPNTSLEFTVQGGTVPDSEVHDYYFELLRTLSIYGADVSIQKDGAYYFDGYVDTDSIGSNYKEKSISFDIISDLTKLKEISPEDESLGYTVDYTTYVYFYDVIRKIVNYALPNVTNWEGEVSDVRATTDLLNLAGDPWAPSFKQLGTYSNHLFGSGLIHETLFELLVSILSTFGLILQIKGNTAYLQQRWDDTGNVDNIELDSIIEGPNFEELIHAFDGLKAKVRGIYTYEEIYYHDYSMGGVGEDDVYEELIFNNSGGTLPPKIGGESNGAYNIIFAYAPANEVGEENEGWTRTVSDRFYINSDSHIPEYALWYVVSSKIYKQIIQNRAVFSCKLRGTNFINQKLYRLPNFQNLIFRPRRYKVNYTDNTTEVEFIKVKDA